MKDNGPVHLPLATLLRQLGLPFYSNTSEAVFIPHLDAMFGTTAANDHQGENP